MNSNTQQFGTKQQLRETITKSVRFKITFECGLNFYRFKNDSIEIINREHEFKFMWKDYETFEKFIDAVWRKIKKGDAIKELKMR